MHLMSFSERAYIHVPEDAVIENGSSYFGVPNTHFDPTKASRLFNEYLDERVYAEELGFDGVMLNEHHDTAFCMGSVMDVEASILARITKKVKIVLLGNPLPVVGNPLRLAEELGMIDMISGGRLVAGWVRGGGSWTVVGNWMGALQEIVWSGDLSGSPLLLALKAVSGNSLAVKFTVDLHQNNPKNVATAGDLFCYGRVLGSIGPTCDGELAQVVPGRCLQTVSGAHTAAMAQAVQPGLAPVPRICFWRP